MIVSLHSPFGLSRTLNIHVGSAGAGFDLGGGIISDTRKWHLGVGRTPIVAYPSLSRLMIHRGHNRIIRNGLDGVQGGRV